LAVVPTIGGTDGAGEGAVVTAAGLARLHSETNTTMATIVLRAGVSRAAAVRDIQRRTGAAPGLEDTPAVILNAARVRHVPTLLAVLLAAMALLTMAHALIVSINGRRHDVAVLRALGASRAFAQRVVHWQATVLAALPLVVGIPLGLAAGSVLFRTYVDHIGAVPDADVPVAVVAAMTAGVLVLGNLAALVPARRARRVQPARLLHGE